MPDEPSPNFPRALAPRWVVYALAAVAPLATICLRQAIAPGFEDRPLLILFVPPILLCAYLGGLRPGLVATAISGLVVDYFAIPPQGSLAIDADHDLVQWLMLIVSGMLISVLSERLHRGAQRLRESQDMLSAIIEGTTDAVYMKDVQGRYLLVNKAVTEMCGKTAAEIISRDDTFLFPGPEGREIMAGDRQVMESGTVQTYREAGTLADGALHNFFSTKGPVRDGAGRVVGLYGIARDITQLSRAEAALADKEALLQAMLRNLPFDFWARGQDGRIVMQSRESVRIWGDLSSGGQSEAHIGEKNREAWERNNARALAGEVVEAEREDALPSGMRRSIHEIVAPILKDGQSLGIMGINIDITARKAAEAELARQRILLESVVEGISDPVYAKDREGRYLLANTETARALGRHVEDILGSDDTALFPPEEAGPLMEQDRRIMQGGEVLTYEEQLTTALGSRRYLTTKGPLRNGQGKVVGLFGIARDITERKAAEEALLQSERRYRELVEGTDNLVTQVDAEGRFLYVNAVAEKVFGLPPEDCTGRLAFDFIHPDDREATRRAFASWVEDGLAHVTLENRQVSATGEERALFWTCNLHYGPDGTLRSINSIAQDITERKLAEEAQLFLLKSGSPSAPEGFFPALARFLAEKLDMGYVCIDRLEGDGLRATTVAVYADGQFEDNVTYTLADTPCGSLVGQTFCFYPNGVQQLFPNDEALRQLKAESYLGVTLWDARSRPIGLIALISRKPVANIRRAETLLRLVAFRAAAELERQVAEQVLRDNRRVLETILNTVPQSIFWKDTSSNYLGCNQAFARAAGLGRPEDILGRSDFDLPWTREESEAYRADDRSVMRTRQGKRSYLEQQTLADGRRLWVETSKLPLLDDSGEALGVMGIYEDVTARIEAEELLRRSKQAAEEASRAKGEFLANMSHEIRTPLNGVLGMVELLKASSQDDEQRSYAEKAAEAARRLLELLSDILDFSKIEAGKMTLAESVFSLGEVFETVENVLGVAAQGKGLALEFQADPSVPPQLKGDDARIRQILFNLVGNAVKFTRMGGVRVEAWALPLGARPGRVRLCLFVSDTGVGIPDEKLGVIFDRFTQSDASQARKFEGAGLGLAIVKRMVELMGGDITVDSELGRGTSIYLTLDLGVASAEEAGQARRRTGVSPAAVPPLRILLAEDELIGQLALRVLLERMGHSVTAVQNGLEALAALRAQAFDCILMDVQMPEMDGVTATRAIRGDEGLGPRAKVPIIALTAYAMPGDRERFLAAGMDGHVAKPVQLSELVDALARVAEARPARA